jgi:hypothetical protein
MSGGLALAAAWARASRSAAREISALCSPVGAELTAARARSMSAPTAVMSAATRAVRVSSDARVVQQRSSLGHGALGRLHRGDRRVAMPVGHVP